MNLSYSEFYITNVCNLNCTNCNRFNNFSFTGHQRWNDYVDIYKQWADILEINEIGILGGEPMLNPDFMLWINGLHTLWPDSKIKIITNGSQLNRYPELYEFVSAHAQKVKFELNFHGITQKEKVIHSLMAWLQHPIDIRVDHNEYTNKLWTDSWNRIKDNSWPDCPTPQDFVNLPEWIQQECIQDYRISLSIWEDEVCCTIFSDANGVIVNTSMANYFNDSTVLHDPITNKLTLNNSNPKLALEVCYSKQCHHFIHGQLYKCGPVGILPEFIKQFNVEMSDDDRALINSYVPANVNWTRTQLEEFIADLKNLTVIPQCKFCPETTTVKKFDAGIKKIKLTKQLSFNKNHK